MSRKYSVTQEQLDAAVYLTYHEAFELTAGDTMDQVWAKRMELEAVLRARYPNLLADTIEEGGIKYREMLLEKRKAAFELGWDVAEIHARADVDTFEDKAVQENLAGGVHDGLMEAIDELPRKWKMLAFAKLAGLTETGIANLAACYLADAAKLAQPLPERSVNLAKSPRYVSAARALGFQLPSDEGQ